ncbi:MAG: autotransporter domain-containing protein, partial [Rickettsiales bacterium]|nr:autotransporter domain-containing protein [Rickettsiales bacterium]
GNSTAYDYNSTNFGTLSNVLASLTIDSGSSLTLSNNAYITTTTNNGTLILNTGSRITGTSINTSGTTYINTDDAISGSIYGIGSVVIGNSTAYDYNSTNFGTLSNVLASLTIDSGSSLTLSNNAYITTTLNSGTLNLEDNSFLAGTVTGGTINVNTDYNNLSGGNYTIFGTSISAVELLNITNGNSLTLNNTNYINSIDILSQSNTNYPSLSLKGNGISNVSLNLNNSTSGITYDRNTYIGAVITLKNTTGNTNNEYMTQMYDLTQVLNNAAADTSLDFSDNNLYLNVLSNSVPTGTSFLIDSSATTDYFSEASLTYEGIYLNLKLEVTGNDLYLNVENNRYPTTDIVSEATITAANVVNSWTFSDETLNDMILVSNLQNIVSNSDFYHALQNITPDVSGLNKEMIKKSLEISLGNIDKRLNTYRMMKFNSNTADYNMKRQRSQNIKYYEDYFTKPFNESNIWIEGFGGTLKQKTIENIFGYDATFTGFSLGYDIRVNNNFLFGLSYTLNQYDAIDKDYIKSTRDNMTATTNNFDLYSMLYGKWAYLSLDIGGSYNELKQQRKINFYNFDKIAKSDYKGYSYYGKSEFGFNILLYSNANEEKDTIIKNVNAQIIKGNKQKKLKTYKKGVADNFIMLTPKIAATYGNIMIDNFKEKGADAADLEIETEDYEFLNISGGLSLSLNNTLSNGMLFRTMLNGYANNNIRDNKVELKAKYEDDTQYFNVYGFETEKLTYNGEISFNLDLSENFGIGIGYDYIYSKETVGQLIKANILIMF